MQRSMPSIHAIFIFHVAEQCLVFHGQVDDEALPEDALAALFQEGMGLLIGQGKACTISGQSFAIVNLEDIIASVHAAMETDEDRKRGVDLVTTLARTFKNAYQSEIDELDARACDVNATFGDFALDVQAILQGKSTGRARPAAPEAHAQARNGASQAPAGAGIEPRFPGGMLRDEERDEVLFQQYENLSGMYNVDMVGGSISKVIVYLYSDVGVHDELQVDFSDFPTRPGIHAGERVMGLLDVSSHYQGWNPEDPPRIVDLVIEIESLLQSMSPGPATGTDAVTGGDAAGPSASDVLANRLLARDRGATTTTAAPDDTGAGEGHDSAGPAVAPGGDAVDGAGTDNIPAPVAPVPAAPRPTFVIKPRFQGFDDDDVQAPAPATSPPRHETSPAVQAPPPVVPRAKPAATGPAKFVIPDVDQLDTFTPLAVKERPALGPAPPTTVAPAPGPAPRAGRPVPATPAANPPATKPRPQKKDEGVMFEWGDDEDMEIKPKREIKDIDIEIKKVD